MSGLDLSMLMTDQVHLAAQLEAEFTLAPRSFSLSQFLPIPLLVSLSLWSNCNTIFYCKAACVCMCVCVRERGEGEGNGTIMFLASLSHSTLCVCASAYVSLYPSGYRWRWGGSYAFKALSCPVRLFLCVYLSLCMAWKVLLWLQIMEKVL